LEGAAMNGQKVDLRQFKRVFFAAEENIAGAVAPTETADQKIPIKFLSLSEGGISFQAERNSCRQIVKGQVITLKKNGTGLLAFLDNIKVQVIYLLDYDIVPQVTFGCEFSRLSQNTRQEIKKIIEAKFMQKEKGQEFQ
jgi:hypothetical protein